MNRITTILSLACLLTLAGCSETGQEDETDSQLMTFDVVHPAQTRATADNFENKDSIGLYVTEHNLPLEVSGNYVNNARLTYDGSIWKANRNIYWNDGTYDVFAYYPYIPALASVDDAEFEVALDQTTVRSESALGGFEASDFLWADHVNVTGSNTPVTLQFKHRMSKLDIRLVKGEDYEGDLPEDAVVYIHNTVPSATIDLSAGIVTPNPYGIAKTIRAQKRSTQQYSAIIVPQRLTNRKPLVEVVMKGVSYLMESTFVFKPGIQHKISLVISKNPEQVKIEIGGEIENWD